MPLSSSANPATAAGKSRRAIWFLGIMVSLLGAHVCHAAGTNAPAALTSINLGTPAVMTGTFYEIGSDRKKVLFKYRRAATSTGDLIQVEQTFAQPDGVVVCRENIIYRAGKLDSYAMEDLRAGIRGSIVIEHASKKKGGDQILLDYIENRKSGPKIHKATESLEPNTLISDTIYPYILTHWDDLMQGTVVKFHFISLDPATTLNFRLVKEAETNWQGKEAVRIKMEASNFIVAHWIDPIYFTIEKAPPHRAFSYIGRTTPRTLVDGAWKPMDAEAVFDWP